MSDKSCIICDPPARYVIAETELSIATYFPRAIKRGHFVVAVKEHVPSFTDLSVDQARDSNELALRLAKKAVSVLNAEKVYLAVIGDKDRHYHVHVFPKMPEDEPMGKHIMLDEGWKGEVGEAVSDAEVTLFIAAMRGEVSE